MADYPAISERLYGLAASYQEDSRNCSHERQRERLFRLGQVALALADKTANNGQPAGGGNGEVVVGLSIADLEETLKASGIQVSGSTLETALRTIANKTGAVYDFQGRRIGCRQNSVPRLF